MASPLDALKTKLGPAPAWMWLAVGAGILYLGPKLGLFGARATAQPVIPRSTPSPSQQQPAGPSPASTPQRGLAPGASGVTVWNGQVYHYAVTAPGQGPNEALRTLGLPVNADALGRLTYFTPNPYHDPQGNTVWYMGLLDAQGLPLPTPRDWSVWPPYAGPLPTGGPAATGGARLAAGRAPGRRQDAPWHWHGHPAIKQQVHFPHYVLAGAGGTSVHAVARSAGLHPARLVAANPHLHYSRSGGSMDNQSQPLAHAGVATSRGSRLFRGGAYEDSGGPEDDTGGAGQRLPVGHAARAGQLIRVR